MTELFPGTINQLNNLSVHGDLVKVTKSTRAPRMGRQIVCPKCNTVATVYHFAWSGLQCQHCKQMIDKYDWSVV